MNETMSTESIPGSFRDPSGFLFRRKGVLYRQINQAYRECFDRLLDSGLYEKLRDESDLVSHSDSDTEPAEHDRAYRVIRPEVVPFVSYPYEWCFSQLKDAALLTLKIAETALQHDMVLKDASAYNIQFMKGRPIFIDTLSFDHYREGEAWVAYRQFCQHFLAPLALMALVDIRFNQWFRVAIDGIPLDLASTLLPGKTRWKPGLAMHIHLHSRSQQKFADRPTEKEAIRQKKVSRQGILGIISSLRSVVRSLKWELPKTEWGEYYDATNYTGAAMQTKQDLVARMLDQIAPASVWDLGANTGLFSRIASDRGIETLAFDIDPVAVEKNYLDCCANRETHHLPLLQDLTNPSVGIGWNGDERMSLIERGPADAVLALALVHHLAISNNVPNVRIAEFFAGVSRNLIVEFVPKSDSQVRRLLATREDVFPRYTRECFEEDFRHHFDIDETVSIEGTERILYRMKRRGE